MTKQQADLPNPAEIKLPPRDYQPSKAELEEEVDMPGAALETLRQAFFRPVKIIKGRAARKDR